DVRLEPLQISIARFFQNKLEVAGILPRSERLPARRSLGGGGGSRHSLSLPFPAQRKYACKCVLISGSAEQRLKCRQIRHVRGNLAAVIMRVPEVQCPSRGNEIGVIQRRAEIV